MTSPFSAPGGHTFCDMLDKYHLREGGTGQKGERNNNGYFVALGRAAPMRSNLRP